jgi:tetratricopeptide (TPR) repeat protein
MAYRWKSLAHGTLLVLLGLGLHGSLAWSHGSAGEEIETLTSRIAAGGGGASDFLRRAELHRLRGEWDAAAGDLDTAVRLDPARSEIVVCRAALLLDRSKPAEALALLDQLLARAPAHAQALVLRARALEASGRPLQAVRDLDRLLDGAGRASPDHYLERSRLLVSCGSDHRWEALRGLDRGIARLGPLVSLESAAIDLELGLGRAEAALARLDAIAPQFARREVVLERRGRILATAGRSEEARAAYAAALAELELLPSSRRGRRDLVDLEARVRAALEDHAQASRGSSTGAAGSRDGSVP